MYAIRSYYVNDDGYQAEGIKILVDSLKEYGNVYVMAPETQQSGASHCITVHTFVRIHESRITSYNVCYTKLLRELPL